MFQAKFCINNTMGDSDSLPYYIDKLQISHYFSSFSKITSTEESQV